MYIYKEQKQAAAVRLNNAMNLGASVSIFDWMIGRRI